MIYFVFKSMNVAAPSFQVYCHWKVTLTLNFVFKMMNFAFKSDELRILNDEFCIESDRTLILQRRSATPGTATATTRRRACWRR